MIPRTLTLALASAALLLMAQTSRAESSGAPIQITSLDTRREGNLAIAQGDVVISMGETTLYCDYAQYDSATKNVFVSGNVRIYRQGNLFVGDRAIYNLESKSFTGANFRAASGAFLAQAHALRSVAPRVFEASTAFFTTDDDADPSFRLRARTIRFYQDDRSEYENVTLFIGRTPVLWLPYLYQPADQSQSFSITPGSRGAWGAFLLTKFAFPISDTAQGELRFDLMSKRGVAIGMDASWKAPEKSASPSWGRFRSYYLSDANPDENVPSDLKKAGAKETLGKTRYRISVQDRSYLSETVYTTVDVNKLSDFNFQRDFDTRGARLDPNPPSLIAATKWDEDYTLTLIGKSRINKDFDGSGRKPELALDIKRQPFLDSGVFYEGETSVSKLSRNFGLPVGLTDYSFSRKDTFHQWLYPQTFGGWLSVVPRFGVRATRYSQSILDPSLAEGAPDFADGKSLTRIATNFGLEASFKFSRTFDSVENRSLGLDGLRHIVQPFADLSIVQTNTDASRILPFDSLGPNTRLPAIDFPLFNSIDSITDWKILRLGVRNRLQTRRDDQTLNWLEWETYVDANIERPQFSRIPLSDSGTMSNVANHIRWNPLPWLRSDINCQLPLLDQGFTEFDSRTNFQVTRDLGVQLSNRFLSGHKAFTDSNLVGAGARVRINDNWAFSFHNSYDFATRVSESQSYTIDRDLRSWLASFSIVVREQDFKRDVAVLLSLTLKEIPKISIPLKYDSGSGDGAGSGKNR